MKKLSLLTFLAVAFLGVAQSATAQLTSDPVPFAITHVDAWWEGAESRTIQAMKSSPEDLTSAQVVITDDNLLDDSIRSARVTLNIVMGANGWKIDHRIEEYRCREGRGHQDFSSELCF